MKKEFDYITLPNGLRLLLVSRPASFTSTVLVLVEAGSEYEEKRTNGLSHFLEHMMFKGTTRRPRTQMIAEELDSLGADFNAFTGDEYTGYWAKAENHKLPQIVDLIADLYLNPLFQLSEIEKERGVIVEEINMYEDSPSDYVRGVFGALLYGDQPAGWRTEGRKEVVRALTREDFLAYRHAHYVAPKTVVAIAGAFSRAAVLKQVKDLFGKLPRARALHKAKTTASPTGRAVAIYKKDSAQSHMILGMRGFPITDRRRTVAKVLANVLGGGMSSRLWRKVREELGAAYYVSAHSESMLDHGNFTVSAGVEHGKVKAVLAATLAEMKLLTETLVPPEELQKAKDHMVGNFVMGLETSDELANFYGAETLLMKTPRAQAEVVKKLRAVTREEIRAVARALFKEDALKLAVLGPHENEAELKGLLTF